MHKIIYFLILPFTYIYALEPSLAILYDVNSNDTQKLNIGNYNFYCSPYGIHTLESLYKQSKPDSLCKKSIDKFYINNPNLKYFSADILHLKQRYHINIKENKCILYAKGELSLSELLLKKGLAVLKAKFKDKEFAYKFKSAQTQAKFIKNGLWDTDIQKNCISEILSK